jgi:hypothetical protein
MSLSDLASIGTLVSSVAVFVSLIYLGLQMRQNAKHTRALIHQARIDRVVGSQLRSTEPNLAASEAYDSGFAALVSETMANKPSPVASLRGVTTP